MKAAQLALLEDVKAAGEDFEWYPTTRAMLEVIANNVKSEFELGYGRESRAFSILDIGAGNGSALETLCKLTSNEGQKYAVEKSKILIDSMPSDIFIVGTDFHQQTLIDKAVDVVFCNPPYSEFQAWMRRIVSEANCRIVYMVVPRRWRDDASVIDMIRRRCDLDENLKPVDYMKNHWHSFGSCAVLLSSSFNDSEYRQARAEIDIVKIKFKDMGYREMELDVDPFDIWFEDNFKIDADAPKSFEDAPTAAQKLHELVAGQHIIERLEELYRADFDRLLTTYRGLEKLEYTLFKELGVDLKQVRGGLMKKIKGLKILYWNELFANLDAITNRLTSKSRKKMLDKLTAHTNIDFTADNAYAVTVWAIKNANTYFDSQLLEVYLSISDRENICNYKSNKKLVEDGWRYQRGEHTHYTLDYRLVLNKSSCLGEADYYSYPNGLSCSAHELLGDLRTIAENLGFKVETSSMDFQWSFGRKCEFFMGDGTLFMDVKAHLKGTIHIRCNQAFMRRFNIEAGRLNGWIKSPAEAKAETGIEDAAELYGSNFKLKSIRLIGDGVSA